DFVQPPVSVRNGDGYRAGLSKPRLLDPLQSELRPLPDRCLEPTCDCAIGAAAWSALVFARAVWFAACDVADLVPPRSWHGVRAVPQQAAELAERDLLLAQFDHGFGRACFGVGVFIDRFKEGVAHISRCVTATARRVVAL